MCHVVAMHVQRTFVRKGPGRRQIDGVAMAEPDLAAHARGFADDDADPEAPLRQTRRGSRKQHCGHDPRAHLAFHKYPPSRPPDRSPGEP